LLGGWEHAGGEYRRVRYREVERRAPHAPGLEQALLPADGRLHPFLRDVPHPGVEGEERRPGRAVLNSAPPGRVDQTTRIQPVTEVVRAKTKRDDARFRNLFKT